MYAFGLFQQFIITHAICSGKRKKEEEERDGEGKELSLSLSPSLRVKMFILLQCIVLKFIFLFKIGKLEKVNYK
jgi:hypothetical protein